MKLLTRKQKYTIAEMLQKTYGKKKISKSIGKRRSTVNHELSRNKAKRGYFYRSAHEHEQERGH